jgi:serine/threonine protein phosphatase 1
MTYAIADLHGRYDLLTAAIDAIAEHAAGREFKIVTLGDYVDRGPQSRQIIEYLMGAQDAGAPIICLKGNHEDMMHETLMAPLDPNWWVGNGGETTLKSYNNEVPSNHLHWIKNLPKMHVDKHRVFVHAGIDPTRKLDDQNDEHLMWFRYIEGTDEGHGDRHVVHGHTPNPHGPVKLKNRTNLDTLAWRTGRLVIAAFDDDMPGPALSYIEVKR